MHSREIMPETFYSMYERKKISVKDSDISVRKKNNRFQLVGKDSKGRSVFKFCNEATAKKYK